MNSDQLQRERAMRVRMVPVTAVAALLLVAAAITGLVGTHPAVSEETLILIVDKKRFPLDLIGAVIDAAGLIGLAAVLNFLWTATKARRPPLPPAFRYMALAGGVIAGISGIVYSVAVALAAHKFVTSGQQTYSEAHHLSSSAAVLVPQVLGYLGGFLLGVAGVIISLNAMRVGLLPKAMGYLGIFVGILFVFPIVPVFVIQAGWMLALAYLFYGRWPNMYPPAWTTGEAVPWPSSQRTRTQSSPPARGARAKPRPTPEPEVVAAPASGTTRATTPKRKRKRRR